MIKNRKGFTLIELIIVMAIIGILAVIAVIAVSNKSAEARDARRLNDASQIRTAFSLYTAENGSVYLEGPADATDILLHELINRADLTYLSLDNVKDPIVSRTDTCYSGGLTVSCDRAGGYTLFDVLPADSDHMGTFANYAIGMKLEQTADFAFLDKVKFELIKPVYAATCNNDWVCEGDETTADCPEDCDCWDGYCNPLDEDEFTCPQDCADSWCGDWVCEGDETTANCANDCWCGDNVCNALDEDEISCPADCGGGGAACDNDFVCDILDGEDNFSCPGDCPCNNNFMCDAGESIDWCYCDCGGVIGCGGGPVGFCGDGLCSPAEMTGGTCPADCDADPVGEDEDTNDWLYINQNGIQRMTNDEDITDITLGS